MLVKCRRCHLLPLHYLGALRNHHWLVRLRIDILRARSAQSLTARDGARVLRRLDPVRPVARGRLRRRRAGLLLGRRHLAALVRLRRGGVVVLDAQLHLVIVSVRVRDFQWQALLGINVT